MWTDSLTIFDPVQDINDRLDAEVVIVYTSFKSLKKFLYLGII